MFGASAADGTFSASAVINGVRYYVYDFDGAKLSKANGAVQFIYNGTVLGAGTYGFLTDGLFSAGTISIPGQAGQTVAITIEVWDKTKAATYDIASAFGPYWLPQTVTITLGGAGTPAATPAPLTGYTGGQAFLPVPEPTTVALAALGLGGLLFVRRRK